MARARNIKPGFFRNADLVELAFEDRLLFIGLWTLADRDGRLEDRPKQIKMELFPADSVDCNAMMDSLAATGMVARYEVDGKRYLQVVNFNKHQNPHRDEKASTIPDQFGNTAKTKQEPAEHSASTVQTPCTDDASTVAIVLNPDPRSLTPDSLIPEALTKKKTATAVAKPDGVCDSVWGDYIKTRKTKPTQTAIDGIKQEADAAGWTLENALRECCARGWTGFKADWVADKPKARESPNGETAYQRSMRERVAEFSPSIARQAPGVYPLKNMILEAENVTAIAGH